METSAPASASALPNRQYVTVATGKFNGSSSDKLAVYQLSPYVTKNNVFDYGVGFSFNAATGATTQAAATTAVISPITASCFACHDSTTATDHMKHEGGSIYEARGTALTKAENCMACHGPDRLASIRAAHQLK